MINVIDKIKGHSRTKRIALWMLMPRNQAKPRLWVKWFLNPFFHTRKGGATICSRTRLDVLPFNQFSLGKNSTIEDFATINNGVGAVVIGDNVRIGIGNVIIGPVVIKNNVILAQNVILSGMNHKYEDINVPIRQQKYITAEIIIEEDCWVGANAVITAGTVVGRHSVVAAGSVVTKDVPPFTLVGGNPARILKHYDKQQQAWLKYKP